MVSCPDLPGVGACLVQSVSGDVCGDNRGTLVQQAQSGGLPDSRSSAGYQDPVACQSLHSALLSGTTGHNVLGVRLAVQLTGVELEEQSAPSPQETAAWWKP
jgi:hypothetical protein